MFKGLDVDILYLIFTVGEDLILVTEVFDDYRNVTKTTSTIKGVVDLSTIVINDLTGNGMIARGLVVVKADEDINVGDKIRIGSLDFPVIQIDPFSSHQEVYLG